MLSLVDFSFEFAGRYLYKDASWHIKPNEKIGLVGLNGTGKSTLLRIIDKEFELREGKILVQNNLRIGFLNQDLLSQEYDGSILEMVLEGREDLSALDKEINRLLKVIETDHSDKTLDRLATLQEEFGIKGGYDWQAQGEKILEGLGFKTEELSKPVKLFSGGWRMRAMLARFLLMEPDLLLLDEPTNHLDLPTINWLESYLATYDGTYIVVSHDRMFLDKTANRIVEVAHRQLFHYVGNFSDYLDQKEERDELMQRKYDNQQDFIRQQMRFIERFRSKASKATAVQSRVKQINKIEKIELLDSEASTMNIKFNLRVTPGKQIVEIADVCKSYGDLEIFDHTSANIYRGDRIALVGANGKGKSTLLRMIVGSEPYEGKINLGWNVESTFYAQHQLESLNLKNNLLEELATVGGEYTENELRTTLGCFLFTGEEVFKKIKVLSGGEKSRVALAKTLLTKANFLLLDEPTNHLDMFSTSVLAEAIENYKGTCLFVSHDRTFISKVANKIWWVENGTLREFIGDFEEYQEWEAKRVPEPPKTKKTVVAKPEEKPLEKPVEDAPKVNKFRLNQLEKLIGESETKIAEEKKKIAQLEQELGAPETAKDFKKTMELSDEYEKLKTSLTKVEKELHELMEEWLGMQ